MKHTLLILGLLWALGASGQIYINSFTFGGGAPPATLLLDDYPNAAAAYSLRKLRTAYTGNCIEVRRSNDNTTSNIGFSGNYLDTAALKTFCGSNSCFVRTWYDQSTNARNVIQTADNTRQPRIVNAGTIERRNGQCTVFFDGTNDVLQITGLSSITAPVTTFTVHTYQSIASPSSFPYVYDHGNDDFILDDNAGAGSLVMKIYNGASVVSNIGTINVQYLTYALFNTTSSVFTINTSTFTGSTGTRTGEALTLAANGGLVAGGFFNGNIQEFVTYFSNQSTNQANIRANINSFYNVYWDGSQQGLLDQYPGAAAAYSLRALNSAYTGALIRVRRANDSAESDIFATYSGYLDTVALKNFCAGTDCFVRTWYDQSTNARNAIQTTNNIQPQIVTAGNLYYNNGRPCINANTSFRFLTTTSAVTFTAYYASVVSNVTGTFGGYAHIIGLEGSPFNQFYRPSGNWRYFASSDFATNVTFASGQRLLTFVDNNTNTVIHVNGVSNTTINATPNVTNQNIRIIGYSDSGAMQGDFQECIFYTSNQSSNRTGIESNINSFYNIY